MNKDGFSLVESMVSLLIMSVLIMSSMMVMTMKLKPRITSVSGGNSTISPAVYIIDCNNATSPSRMTSCANAYINNYNRSCMQVITAWSGALTGTYSLTPNNATSLVSVSCNTTSLASTAITGCNGNISGDCAYAYNNNYNVYSANSNSTCAQLTSAWPGRPNGNYNLTTSATTWVSSGCGLPPDPACGTVTIGAIKVSLCNNTHNLVPGSTYPGASGCWQGTNTACTGTGCGTSPNYKATCNHQGAVDACTDLNGGVNYTIGGINYNWRLPTDAELATIGTAANRTSADICDRCNGSAASFCGDYGGCNNGNNGQCYPGAFWSAEGTGSTYNDYYLCNGSWIFQNSNYWGPLSARCVRTAN